MAVKVSPVLDVLQTFEAQGVRLIVCNTCLDHNGLAHKVKVTLHYPKAQAVLMPSWN